MYSAVFAAKFAQRQGKRVLWFTHDQQALVKQLSQHGCLCALVGEDYIVPYFREEMEMKRNQV